MNAQPSAPPGAQPAAGAAPETITTVLLAAPASPTGTLANTPEQPADRILTLDLDVLIERARALEEPSLGALSAAAQGSDLLLAVGNGSSYLAADGAVGETAYENDGTPEGCAAPTLAGRILAIPDEAFSQAHGILSLSSDYGWLGPDGAEREGLPDMGRLLRLLDCSEGPAGLENAAHDLAARSGACDASAARDLL